ncbi:MAG: alpha/beta hydrolase [Psychromonas sp.]
MRILSYVLLLISLTACSAVDFADKQNEKELYKSNFSQQQLQLENNGKLNYWIAGQGEPVLLIHGFAAGASASWKDMMLELSKDHQVIAPDLFWFGESDSDSKANLLTQTLAIQALIEHLQLDELHVVGISFGGFVAFDLMVQEPKVKTTTLIASPAITFSDDHIESMTKRLEVTDLSETFVPQNAQQMRHLLELSFNDFPWLPNFIDDDIYQRHFASHLDEKIQLIETLPNDRERVINATDIDQLPPTLLIWGSNDRIFPLSSGLELADKLETSIVVIDNGPHALSNEHPEIISQSIRAFIERNND